MTNTRSHSSTHAHTHARVCVCVRFCVNAFVLWFVCACVFLIGSVCLCVSVYKRLASMLSDKHKQPYSKMVHWLLCRLSIFLLRSSIRCLRGSHTSIHDPAGPLTETHSTLPLFVGMGVCLLWRECLCVNVPLCVKFMCENSCVCSCRYVCLRVCVCV